MKIKFIGTTIPSSENESYDNMGAHSELKSMMQNHDRLMAFFDVDKDGYEVIKVESNSVSRFSYQINEKSLSWFLNYLDSGEYEDFEIDPKDVHKVENKDGNSFRKEMIKEFESSGIHLQYTPTFRDKKDKLTANANFRFGRVFFFVYRDDDIMDYLREKNLIH